MHVWGFRCRLQGIDMYLERCVVQCSAASRVTLCDPISRIHRTEPSNRWYQKYIYLERFFYSCAFADVLVIDTSKFFYEIQTTNVCNWHCALKNQLFIYIWKIEVLRVRDLVCVITDIVIIGIIYAAAARSIILYQLYLVDSVSREGVLLKTLQ